MTGSVLDDKDAVQDTLFQAYRKLDTFDDSRPLAPSMLGNNPFGAPLPLMTDDAGSPLAVVAIAVDDKLAFKAK